MNLYSRTSIGEVMRKIAQGLRYIWPDPDYAVPNDCAISQRHYQLGARPLVALFHRVYQPLATPETAGAFLFSLRLMAIDGSTENIADTPENAAAFGRFHAELDPKRYPALDLACAYHERWEAEAGGSTWIVRQASGPGKPPSVTAHPRRQHVA